MVLYRTRACRLVSSGLAPLCVLVLAASCGYGLARAGGSGAPKPSGSDERLRELMTQRYELLKVSVKNSELLLASGRVDIPTHQNLLDALYRAEADLCTTAADRITVYEKLVEVLIAQEKLVERQAEAGRALGIQVAQAKLVTLNTQIDLERLRLAQSAVPQ
ncbi:MAG: hypothetical protein NTZ17_20580 [Phycisphaerae bacterium]|nr:hypothetical protein [Phycisphaerae bacterium]